MRFCKSSLSALVGSVIEDYGVLTLAEATAYASVRDIGNGASEYALLIGRSLGRRALMDLLYSVAPYKAHGPDRFARVLDNWRLHDRAKTSTASESLLLQHSLSLKANWEVFAAHRNLFIEVLEDLTETVRVVPFLSWTKDRNGRRRWKLPTPTLSFEELAVADSDLSRLASEGKSTLDALVGLVTVPYLFPRLRANWPQWQPLVRGGKSNYVGPASSAMISLQHRRALLNCPLVVRTEAFTGGASSA